MRFSIPRRRQLAALCGALLVLGGAGLAWLRVRAASHPGSATRITSVRGGVELVAVSGGRFFMGSASGEPGRAEDEGPLRIVNVPAFYLAIDEVTNEQYDRYLAENPQVIRPASWDELRASAAHQPVVGVSWEDARRFAAWAGCRLPTEAEWEYAARAGSRADYGSGSSEADLARVAWYADNAGDSAHDVGGKPPNAWGIHDLLGNVWEWVEDDYHTSLRGAPGDGSAWIDRPRAPYRVLRGGAWNSPAASARCAARSWNTPLTKGASLGFRLAADPGAFSAIFDSPPNRTVAQREPLRSPSPACVSGRRCGAAR